MEPRRTIPPRIRWSDGSEGIEQPEGLADRMRLTMGPITLWRDASADFHRRRQAYPETELDWTGRRPAAD
jgi:hypothetical protein